MTSITARNAAALAERNGTTLPKTKAPQAKETKAEAPAPEAPVAEAPAPKPTPTGVPCGCGCGATTNPGRLYRPGHDARHAGQVGRMLAAKAPGAEEAALALPAALETKARAFAANREREEAKKAASARIRAAAKAALAAELAAL